MVARVRYKSSLGELVLVGLSLANRVLVGLGFQPADGAPSRDSVPAEPPVLPPKSIDSSLVLYC